MYTGLPLMPATTPVYSGLAPRSRARIMSCPGPRALCSSPRISTSIASGCVPSKTVYATPCKPRCTWSSGKTPAATEGGGVVGSGAVFPGAASGALNWAFNWALRNNALHAIKPAAKKILVPEVAFPQVVTSTRLAGVLRLPQRAQRLDDNETHEMESGRSPLQLEYSAPRDAECRSSCGPDVARAGCFRECPADAHPGPTAVYPIDPTGTATRPD